MTDNEIKEECLQEAGIDLGRYSHTELTEIKEALRSYHIAKLKLLPIQIVSVSLPSVDDAGIIAVAISEINNEMTAQEQAFFIAGFSECIKYLEMQSNER